MRAQRGMTVIELLVVLAVVGMLTIIGYMGVRYVSKSDLREDAGQVAATLQNGYRMATETGLHHRVVFDLDEQTFRIETCEGELNLRRSDKEQMVRHEDDEEEEEPMPPALEQLLRSGTQLGTEPILDQETTAKIAKALRDSDIEKPTCAISMLPNGDADGRANLRQVRTWRGLKLRRVFVQHLEEPALEGEVTVNFFPLGWAEKAIVELADEDGDQFTILVHGLTGRIEIRDGELRDPNDHMMRDAVGERIEER